MSLDKQSIKKIIVSLLPAVAMVALLTWLYLGSRKAETQPVETDETTEMRPSLPSVPQQENNVASNSQDDITPLQQPPAEQHAQEAQETPLPPVEDFPAEPPPTLGDLSDASLWKQLIDGDFATRFITILDEVTMGFIPVKSLGAFKSDSTFTAMEENDEWFLTAETEARYAPFVELFCSLDPELAGNVFRAIKPSLQSAL